MIVQPSDAHLFDHSYVTSVIRAHPGHFVGCLLADPRPHHKGLQELERLITTEGYRAVRFHPYRWPEGETMANEVQVGAMTHEHHCLILVLYLHHMMRHSSPGPAVPFQAPTTFFLANAHIADW